MTTEILTLQKRLQLIMMLGVITRNNAIYTHITRNNALESTEMVVLAITSFKTPIEEVL